MEKIADIIKDFPFGEIFKKMVNDLKYTIFIMKDMMKNSEKEKNMFRQVLIEEIGKEPLTMRRKIINRLYSATAYLREA